MADTKQITWKEFSATAAGFASSDAIDEIDANSITRMIEKGNANPKRQSRCTAAIRTLCMDLADSPWGSQNALDTAHRQVLTDAQKAIIGFATLVNKGGSPVRALLTPHGRTVVKDESGATVKVNGKAVKKTHFDDGADTLQVMLDNMEATAIRLSKAGWDGTVEGLESTLPTEAN
jgi:hypothetical protein